jgi:hypothetical protein
MKMQYLADGDQDCPLIRLCEFDLPEVNRLRAIFGALADGSRTEVVLHQEMPVECVDGCQLTLRVGWRDVGIADEGPQFECVLTTEGWLDAAFFTQPFCEVMNTGKYQWLNESGEVSLLLSPSGRW